MTRDRSSSDRPQSAEESGPRQRVQICLAAGLSSPSAQRRSAVLDALAIIMGIVSDEIVVDRIHEDSKVFDLRIPPHAARHLSRLLQSGGGRLGLLKVEKVLKVWEAQNRAENPQSAVGKTLAIVLPQEGRLLEQQRRTFRELRWATGSSSSRSTSRATF